MDSAILIVCVDGSWKVGINLKEYLLKGGSVLVISRTDFAESEVSEDFRSLHCGVLVLSWILFSHR